MTRAEFVNFLLGHGAWDAYMRNLRARGRSFDDIYMDEEAINYSFAWAATTEGYSYWYYLDIELRRKYKDEY